MTPAASPSPSTDSSDNNNRIGTLSVTILSAYDLPAIEQPISVSLSCLDQCVTTGAPSARHKDRNSFKFPNQPLLLQSPLPLLYPSTATLTVHYRLPEKNIQATLSLQTLKIHQPTWLILNLSPVDDHKDQYNQRPPPTMNTLQTKSIHSSALTSSFAYDDNSNTSVPPPTLRIQVELQGPFRPEIASLITLAQQWFGVVDHAQHGILRILRTIQPPLQPIVQRLPNSKYILIPFIPLATAMIVMSPIVMGFMILGLPIVLPLLVILFLMLLGLAILIMGLIASSQHGRAAMGNGFQPLLQTVLSTTSGQRLFYETGPRPTLIRVIRIILPKSRIGKLLISFGIDFLGSSSYLLPVVGEAFDIVWAPIQTILLMALYDTSSPNLKYISLVEELLPFTDVIPSGTMGWLAEYGRPLLLHSSSAKTTTVAAAATPSTTTSMALANTNTAKLMQARH